MGVNDTPPPELKPRKHRTSNACSICRHGRTSSDKRSRDAQRSVIVYAEYFGGWHQSRAGNDQSEHFANIVTKFERSILM